MTAKSSFRGHCIHTSSEDRARVIITSLNLPIHLLTFPSIVPFTQILMYRNDDFTLSRLEP